MLAPQPFFEARGTPFSEYHRIQALGELGYHVDLVTYPFGLDVELPHLRIFRCARPPLLRGIRVGPSIAKVVLDALLVVAAARLAVTERYDAVHSHEEAGVLGLWLADWLGVPHLYDMHSSLPQQLANFRYTRSRFVRWIFEWAECTMIADSRVIITICQELQNAVIAAGMGDAAFLIENVMGGDIGGLQKGAVDGVAIRSRYGIDADQPLILYTGTFEEYQGLELLTAAAASLAASHPRARVLVVGGESEQVESARARAEAAGSPMVFAGRRKPEEIPSFLEACDILVSPRVSGTNTPLKIYSYLRSGRPIVATDLRTHTQVLNEQTAVLVPPDPGRFAAAFARLIDRPVEGARLATEAAAMAAERYGREAYLSQTAAAYKRLLGDRLATTRDAVSASNLGSLRTT